MKLFFTIFTAVMFAANIHSLIAQDINMFLPDSLPGWEISVSEKEYTPETLYDYIDGGAELYLSYGMKGVVCSIFQKEGIGEIRVEVFDMGKSEDAFGVFSHTRENNEKIFGQGSQFFTGALIFWKDKYYVSVTANDDNEEIRKAINYIGTQIDNKITTTGRLPEILDLLPKEDVQTDGFIYFHHYIWLNSYYYIADDNFFLIDNTTQAVLANYGNKEHKIHLLLILYPDQFKANQAYHSFCERFIEDPGKSMTRIEDGSWVGSKIDDNLLICVFNADSESQAQSYLHKIHK
jgi:hypothetical protein